MESNDLKYFYENLGGAVDILATHLGGLHERLHLAMDYVSKFDFEDPDTAVPPEIAPRLNEVRRMVEAGCDDAQAKDAAERLLDLFLELHLKLEKRSGLRLVPRRDLDR
jgi:hypothetical protein